MTRRSPRPCATACAILLLLPACAAGGGSGSGTHDQASADDLISEAMTLCRAGDWPGGRAMASRALDRQDLNVRQRAGALSLVATCARYAGDDKGAEGAIAAFDGIDGLPAEHWARREIDRVRHRLDRGPAAAAKPATHGEAKPTSAPEFADVPTEVWNVRYLDSVGRWGEAEDLARRLLASRLVHGADQACDLHLHRAYALRRLGRAAASETAFAAFARMAKRLPADSRLVLEAILLRESLGLPPMPELVSTARRFVPPATDSYWKIAAPAKVGVDGAAVRDIITLARRSGADGILITRRGTIIGEWYSPLYTEPMATMSSCKSITGLLAGLLVDRGTLALDDRVGTLFPAWREGLRGKVTVRHLLTMTSGLPRRPARKARAGEGWTAFALSLEPRREPGSHWEYSNQGVQLLSPLLEHAAGIPLHEFARRALFDPIGATHTRLRRDQHGSTNTFADAETTLREFARFGELVRRRGAWPGRGQVVPAAWIEDMTTPCAASRSYGYLWWLSDQPRCVSMRGYLDTDVWVLPELDVVVARVQSRAYLHAQDSFDEHTMLAALAEHCH